MLGDCWFLAAAASIAEYPERIKRLFVNTEISQEGVYQLKLFKKTLEDDVTVDDKVLVLWDQVLFHSKKSDNGAYWLVILEKATTKFFVTTSNMHGGNPVVAFRFLTNMPTLVY